MPDATLKFSTAEHGLIRLNSVIPLAARQTELPDPWRLLHQTVLRGFVEFGRAPTLNELRARSCIADVAEGLRRLRGSDFLLLDEHNEIQGAYPFACDPRAHQVFVNGHWLTAMCAVDALAISPMFEQSVRIESRCAMTDRPIHLRQTGRRIECLGERPLVGIRWRSPGCHTATTLCRDMLFLAGAQQATAWQQKDPAACEVFTLADAVDLAAGFFLPLIGEGGMSAAN